MASADTMQDMDDEQGVAVDETTEQPVKQEKPRGKCTGCAFEYQLGTARTGKHKGKLVIRKHNSRTGPGLCSGAQQPPYDEQDCACGGAGADDGCPNCSVAEDPHTEGCTPEARFGPSVCEACDEFRRWADTQTASKTVNGHCVQGACTGCCGCSSMCTTDPCGQPLSDVVGVAPGGTPIIAAPTDLVGAITLPPHTVLAPDAQITMTPGINPYVPVMPPVSISEVHAENPPRPIVQRDPDVLAPDPWSAPAPVVTGTLMPPAGPQYTDYSPQPDPWSAPAPASLIPESTTTVSGQPDPDRDRWGRYVLFGQAHTRATTFAKLGANTKAIEAWNERNVIRGLTLRPDLLMLANGLEVKRDRNDLNSIAAQAKDAAGSKVAANIGTAYHAFSERIDAHLMTLPEVPQQYQGRVFQYIDALARAGLTTRPEWIERTTAVRADQVGAPLPVAGTLDRIFQLPDGSLVIGDLKTGSVSYGEMEIEVQLALYAHGVNTHGLFDWNTKTWQPPSIVLSQPGETFHTHVRTDIAIVVHLPADGDGCTLYVADIERGWRDAQRLGPLQSSLKEKKRFRTLTAADLAPRPGSQPVVAPPRPAPVRTGLTLGGFGGDYVQTLQATAPVVEPPDSNWELAKGLFSSAPDQHAIAQLYQHALDSGRFHQDQLAVLVGLGKDRLNALGNRG